MALWEIVITIFLGIGTSIAIAYWIVLLTAEPLEEEEY